MPFTSFSNAVALTLIEQFYYTKRKMSMYYRFTSYGYEGEKDYLEGGEKVTWSFNFPTLEDALEKKRHYEAWAKINNIPPYEISIDEIFETETIVEKRLDEFKKHSNQTIKKSKLEPTDEVIKLSKYLNTIFAYNIVFSGN